MLYKKSYIYYFDGSLNNCRPKCFMFYFFNSISIKSNNSAFVTFRIALLDVFDINLLLCGQKISSEYSLIAFSFVKYFGVR